MSDTITRPRSPLTDEQAAERAVDNVYVDIVVERVEAWGKDPLQFTLTGSEGTGNFRIAPGMAPPEVGDVYRLYGTTGFGGGSWYGQDLRGEPCWYDSEAERVGKDAAAKFRHTKRKKEEWAASEETTMARFNALPQVLRERVDRFIAYAETKDGLTWWEEFGNYEIYALTMATRIANWGPTEAFQALSHEEQGEAIEGLKEGSGNTTGFAKALAPAIRMLWGAETGDFEHPVAEGWLACYYMHAAISPVCGCKPPGCLPPSEQEYDEMRAYIIENGPWR